MMNIQRINDERLQTQNLKNIRTVYAIQTLGILVVMAYQYIDEGLSGMQESPVWILFLASTVILAFLSLKSDERLVAKNLQKIRVAYAIQVIGIFGIVVYDLLRGGISGMSENPLWIVFLISTTVLLFLSMNISVAHEPESINPKKGLTISLFVVLLVSLTIGFLTARSDGSNTLDGIITAVIFLIVGSIPFIFLYAIRKKSEDI